MVIGLSGISGAGKTTIAKQLCKTGNYFHVNIDEIAHDLLDKEYVQKFIAKELGIEVSSSDRKQLAEIIFTDRHKAKAVTDYMWDLMRTRILTILNTYENVVLDWILLPHTEFFEKCDIKILVKPKSKELREAKVRIRDNLSKEDLAKRDKASIEYDENRFDYVITNNYGSY